MSEPREKNYDDVLCKDPCHAPLFRCLIFFNIHLLYLFTYFLSPHSPFLLRSFVMLIDFPITLLWFNNCVGVGVDVDDGLWNPEESSQDLQWYTLLESLLSIHNIRLTTSIHYFQNLIPTYLHIYCFCEIKVWTHNHLQFI